MLNSVDILYDFFYCMKIIVHVLSAIQVGLQLGWLVAEISTR